MAENTTRNQDFLNLFREQQAPGPGDTQGFINLFRQEPAEPETPLQAGGRGVVAATVGPEVAGMLGRGLSALGGAVETGTGLDIPESVSVPPDIVGPTLGEILGVGAGTALTPLLSPFGAAVATPSLAAAGSVAGLFAERALTGRELPTAGRAVGEAVSTAIPEIAEPALKFLGRGLLKGGSEAGEIAGDIRARETLGFPQKLFDPIGRQELDAAFDSVRQAGHTVSPQPFLPVRNLGEDEFKAISDVVKPIGGGRNFLPDLGKQFSRKLEAIRKGGPRAGFDLGELQHIRSELLKAADKPSQKRIGAIDEAIDLIDNAVESGLTIGKKQARSKATPLQLIHARRQWAKHKAAEDMGELIRRSGLSVSADKGLMKINLDKLATSIEFPKTKLEQRVAKDLVNLGKRGKEEMTAFIRRISNFGRPGLTVEALNSFSIGNVHPIQLITDAITTKMGRDAVEFVLLREGKRNVDIRTFAMVSNLVRRAAQSAILPREEAQ